jgi:hypothetical protein
MQATVRGSITVEADNAEEARSLAEESGMELSDLAEIDDSVALHAELFQKGSL